MRLTTFALRMYDGYMKILCEISTRHVHLCKAHVEALFGEELEHVRDLSQPGQFLAKQRVSLVGPKNTLENVAVLGPARPETQVELCRTDTFALGLKNIPLRESGDLLDTPGMKLRAGEREVTIDRGVIVCNRHIHLDPKTAEDFGIVDKQIVKIKFDGPRGGVLDNTVVRVSKDFAPAIHIDADEGNAIGFVCGTDVEIIK